MKHLQILFTLFYLVLFTLSCTQDHNRTDGYRVMTFNIRYGLADDGENSWQLRKSIVFDIVKKYRPDVLGLQEALRFQLDEIRDQFPYYTETGVGRDGGTKGEYSAILFNRDRFIADSSGTFWLSETPYVPSATWGNQFYRICSWIHLRDRHSGSAFYLFNTHLDHQSQPSREQGMQLILDAIRSRKHPDPVVLCGDFNAGEDNPILALIRQPSACLQLKDSFRLLHSNEKSVGTFNGFTGDSTGDKIDYVFVSPEFKVKQAQIIRDNRQGRYPSDHFPVWAVIEANR